MYMRTCSLILWIMAAFATVSVASAAVIYVDDGATGANNGSSWQDAYLYLQDALAMSGPGDEIRVAQGVYRPDQSAYLDGLIEGDRDASFQLKKGVILRGGYAGFGGIDPDQRDSRVFVTILSGDLNGNDGPEFTNTGENSYHVVSGADEAIIDGFTISGGNALWTATRIIGGGGIYNEYASPSVQDCKFRYNQGWYGGALLDLHASSTLTNCIFESNTAGGGGAIAALASCLTATNCLFSNNSARLGGAMDVTYGEPSIPAGPSSVQLFNCNFVDNRASFYGGAIYLDLYSTADFTNCVLWANQAPNASSIYNNFNNDNQPTLRSCDVESGVNGPGFGGRPCVDGGGNINADPCFVDLDADDYHLRFGSPCIDVGDNAAVEGYATDLEGNPRVVREVVDMGPYEYPGPATLRVPYQYPTIQAAIDAAVYGETVLVADGTYTGDGNRDIDFLGKAIVVRSENGPDQCIIDCQGSSTAMRRGFYLHRGETHASIIDGFTIINGTGRIQEYTEGVGLCGGAIACVDSSATVRNCIIRNNESGHGAGIFMYRADVIIEGCTFSRNHNTRYGSAISSWESTALISDCQIENNTSQQGCAVYAWGAGAKTTLRDCSVVRNTGDTWVGGIGLWGESILTHCIVQYNYGPGVGGIYAKANCTLRNCLVTDNSSLGSAGGITIEPEISYPIESFAVIENCTIANNRTEGRTGGLDLDSGLGRAAVVNCIVWGNVGRWYDQIFTGGMPSAATFSFCDIQGGWAGEGNIDGDPRFVDPPTGDYHLTRRSPCVNRGDPEQLDAEPTDIDGDARVMNGRIDIGADELFLVNTPPTADAGNDMTGYAKADGNASVELDGSGSNDPDGDELEYVWLQDGHEIARGVHPTVSLPVGNHIIELMVSDGLDESQSDELAVTVKEAIKAQAFVVPGIINRRSHVRFLYAVIRLPDGIKAEDIDPRESFVLFPGAIDDSLWRGMKQPKGRHTLLVAFDLQRFIKTLGQSGNVEVAIAGRLKSGPYLFATDNIRVIDRMTMRFPPNQR